LVRIGLDKLFLNLQPFGGEMAWSYCTRTLQRSGAAFSDFAETVSV
jgi:hypothetical protein